MYFTEDGPLYTRIFIDAFLPTLESNRIFPLFNLRCAEKIERTSENFYENSRKRTSKKLGAVTSLECSQDNLENRDESAAGATSQNQEIRNENVIELQHGDEIRNADVEERRKLNKIERVQDDQQRKIEERRDVKKAEEDQDMERVQNVEEFDQNKNLQAIASVPNEEKASVPGGEKAREIEKLHETKEKDEVITECQKGDEEILPASITTDSDHPAAVGVVDSHQKSTENERKDEKATEYVDRNVDKSVALTHTDQLTEEEKKLFQKLFRALLDNDELLDLLCEKVISKIAARNDFCGPNCMGTCGGLNKPSKQNK